MPKPIPVAMLAEIARQLDKAFVVVLGYDAADERLYVASYGVTPAAKDFAAKLADDFAKSIYGPEFDQGPRFEDFRATDQAVRAKKIEVLLDACKAAQRLRALHEIIDVGPGGTTEELQAGKEIQAINEQLAAAVATAESA